MRFYVRNQSISAASAYFLYHPEISEDVVVYNASKPNESHWFK